VEKISVEDPNNFYLDSDLAKNLRILSDSEKKARVTLTNDHPEPLLDALGEQQADNLLLTDEE
jgi:hypothetical protein